MSTLWKIVLCAAGGGDPRDDRQDPVERRRGQEEALRDSLCAPDRRQYSPFSFYFSSFLLFLLLYFFLAQQPSNVYLLRIFFYSLLTTALFQIEIRISWEFHLIVSNLSINLFETICVYLLNPAQGNALKSLIAFNFNCFYFLFLYKRIIFREL